MSLLNRAPLYRQTFNVVSGGEGPSHDPYHYTEFVYTRNGTIYRLHLGLVDWVSIDNRPLASKNPALHFELMTGIRIRDLERINFRVNGPAAACGSCGSRKFEWHDGHPGETFQVCATCGEIASSHFNKKAVI